MTQHTLGSILPIVRPPSSVAPAASRPQRDESLERRLQNNLYSRALPGLANVRIETAGGTVVVRGRVPTQFAKRLCLECCKHAAGVLHVVDEVEVGPREGDVAIAELRPLLDEAAHSG